MLLAYSRGFLLVELLGLVCERAHGLGVLRKWLFCRGFFRVVLQAFCKLFAGGFAGRFLQGVRAVFCKRVLQAVLRAFCELCGESTFGVLWGFKVFAAVRFSEFAFSVVGFRWLRKV